MISILIPTLNNLDYLKLCIRSIQENTIVPYEILVWDNGSEKETQSWCWEHLGATKTSHTSYYRVEKNEGLSYAYNYMVRAARGDLIMPADNDYYFLPGWDSLAEEAAVYGWRQPMQIRRDGRATRGICAEYGGAPDVFQEDLILSHFKDKTWPERRKGTFFPLVMRRNDWIEIGGWDERFMIDELSFLWRAYNFYESKGSTQFTHPRSFIYHFGGITPRDPKFSEDSKQSRITAVEEIGKSEDEIDEILDYYSVVGPSLDEAGELIDYEQRN